MKNRALLLATLFSHALLGCSTADDVDSAEAEVSKTDLNLVGPIEIGGLLTGYGHEYVGKPEKRFRSFEVTIKDPSLEVLALSVDGGEKPEVVLYDSKMKVVARSTLSLGDGKHATASIANLRVATAGKYFVAFRDKGSLTSKAKDDNVSLDVAYDVSKLAVSEFSCTSDKAIVSDGKATTSKEKFGFRAAFLGSASLPPNIAPVNEDGIYIKANEDSWAFVLNENITSSVEKDGLAVSGDGDGFALVALKLLKNSGYTKGTFTMEDLTGEESKTTVVNVACTIAGSKHDKLAAGATCLKDADCASAKCIRGIAAYTCR